MMIHFEPTSEWLHKNAPSSLSLVFMDIEPPDKERNVISSCLHVLPVRSGEPGFSIRIFKLYEHTWTEGVIDGLIEQTDFPPGWLVNNHYYSLSMVTKIVRMRSGKKNCPENFSWDKAILSIATATKTWNKAFIFKLTSYLSIFCGRCKFLQI